MALATTDDPFDHSLTMPSCYHCVKRDLRLRPGPELRGPTSQRRPCEKASQRRIGVEMPVCVLIRRAVCALKGIIASMQLVDMRNRRVWLMPDLLFPEPGGAGDVATD